MFIYNILLPLFLHAPSDDIFAHAAIKLKCSFLTCPRRCGISPEVVGVWSLVCCRRWEIVSAKLVTGCISKQREVGGTSCFEGSILLPKWNFWHHLQVLEFPFLLYSQDCRKEWFHIIWASYHHFIVLPCFVIGCKWNLNITQGSRIRKCIQWLF